MGLATSWIWGEEKRSFSSFGLLVSEKKDPGEDNGVIVRHHGWTHRPEAFRRRRGW